MNAPRSPKPTDCCLNLALEISLSTRGQEKSKKMNYESFSPEGTGAFSRGIMNHQTFKMERGHAEQDGA